MEAKNLKNLKKLVIKIENLEAQTKLCSEDLLNELNDISSEMKQIDFSELSGIAYKNLSRYLSGKSGGLNEILRAAKNIIAKTEKK